MGADYYIIKHLDIVVIDPESSREYSHIFELGRNPVYCYCTNDIDSDNSDYNPDYCKCYENCRLMKPIIIYENDNWVKTQYQDKYENTLELSKNFSWIPNVKLVKITKDEFFAQR